jgi:GTP 3',8-cyclase
MLDRFDRQISYLRISVTDRCNLRCVYCMPEEGIKLTTHEDILSFEDIAAIVTTAASIGISKIRLTGGEPLVRRGIVDLVSMLAVISGVSEVAMTTNGTLLQPLAKRLKAAGLRRINISLDTLDADSYRRITRGGNLADALAGIDAALSAELPVKINMVRPPDGTDEELARMREFCDVRGIKLQLIRQYSLSQDKKDDGVYDRPSPCSACNRVRLLADGTLKPCLHSDDEISLDMSDIEGSLVSAIQAKPARGTVCTGRDIIQIGG